MVGGRKLPDHSLSHILNVLSIGVQYMLSFQWTNFGLKCCWNRYTLNKKSYLYWRGIATYLYSQLAKLLLISRNLNYPEKNLIYLNQVYTLKIWNLHYFEKIHHSFLNNLKSQETKSQIKVHHWYLANSYFYNYKPSPHILHQHRIWRNLRKNKDINETLERKWSCHVRMKTLQ